MAKITNPAEDKNTDKEVKNEKKSKLITVEFVKSFTPYVKGDIAGVDQKLFNSLLEKKVVVKFKK